MAQSRNSDKLTFSQQKLLEALEAMGYNVFILGPVNVIKDSEDSRKYKFRICVDFVGMKDPNFK